MWLGRQTQKLRQSRHQIEAVLHRAVHLAIDAARPFDDEGDAAGDVVRRAVFAVDAQLAQILTVVGGEDDGSGAARCSRRSCRGT